MNTLSHSDICRPGCTGQVHFSTTTVGVSTVACLCRCHEAAVFGETS